VHHHAQIEGPTTAGERNVFFPNSLIGAISQDLKYRGGECPVIIGNDNSFRENCTVHMGTEDGGAATRIGNNNLIMVAALVGGALWFVLGIALYLTSAGALGALVDRQEEVGSAVSPLMVILIVSYLVGQSAPESAVGSVLAYIPFTSPMVMPERIALGVASPIEVAASLLIGVITVVVVARLASAIYLRAIVRTGSRTHLRQLLRSDGA
jgi:ABC-type Na+ efflux pump permease subunit